MSSIIKGDVLYSSVGISFWGGIDPLTGNVIDTTHPLHGECISNKILVIPSGRGSCTGSQVMLELILNRLAPRAIILRDPDSLLCTGAIIAEEFFHDECNKNIPIICAIGEDNFTMLLDDDGNDSLSIEVLCEEDICIHYGEDGEILAKDLLKLKNTVDTRHVTTSKAEELALKTIKRIASISKTKDLIPICSAHIDAVTYIGEGGLKFVQRLKELGGKVKVNTTLNSQSCDRRRWKDLGVDESLAHNANSVGDAYLDLGCELSFTCAPYLLASKPKKGDNICWGESNAVVYSNSVLGARTEKYADYFDICSAICGLVPNTGVHIEDNRAPTIVIDATTLIQNLLPSIKANDDLSYDKQGFDTFFPAMGWICGNFSDGGIPLILGFDQLPNVTGDNLKQ
jgi:cis-L-3-hydroxyproline dehydratase